MNAATRRKGFEAEGATHVAEPELLEWLGDGIGQGRVKARLAEGQVVALLRGETADAGRLLDWGRALAQVDHPSVPAVVDLLARPPGVATEFVTGEAVGLRIHTIGRPIHRLEALSWTVRTASALAAVHAVGLAHGRLTTGSILLDEQDVGAPDCAPPLLHVVGWAPLEKGEVEAARERDLLALRGLLHAALGGILPPFGTLVGEAVPVFADEAALDGLERSWRVARLPEPVPAPFHSAQQAVDLLWPIFRAEATAWFSRSEARRDVTLVHEAREQGALRERLLKRARRLETLMEQHAELVARAAESAGPVLERMQRVRAAWRALEGQPATPTDAPGTVDDDEARVRETVPLFQLRNISSPVVGEPPVRADETPAPGMSGERVWAPEEEDAPETEAEARPMLLRVTTAPQLMAPPAVEIPPAPAVEKLRKIESPVPVSPPAVAATLKLQATTAPSSARRALPLVLGAASMLVGAVWAYTSPRDTPRSPTEPPVVGEGPQMAVLATAEPDAELPFVSSAGAPRTSTQAAAPLAERPPEAAGAAPNEAARDDLADAGPSPISPAAAFIGNEPSAAAVDPVGSAPPPAPEGMVYVSAGPAHLGLRARQRAALVARCVARGEAEEACAARFAADGPARVEPVGAFFIDRLEVTQGDWVECVKAGACTLYRRKWHSQAHPATAVTRAKAEAFCAWRGGRLPTAAEWTRAARGDDGRLHPWGDDPWDAGDTHRTNAGAVGGGKQGADGHFYPAPSDAFVEHDRSAAGAVGMGGNVREWTADTVDGKAVVMGGGWLDDPFDLRATRRAAVSPKAWPTDLGVRCARDLP